MKVFGLTGGIGMGKSTAEAWLRRRGVPVVDTDLLARQVVEPGQPTFEEIRRSFGEESVGPDGHLRREVLARIVFSDSVARQKLERITHPRIRELWTRQVADWRAQGETLAVVVIPLLFETGAQTELDVTLCLACSPETQRQRLLARGWDISQINQRLAAQWPIERKLAAADYVVWTEGPFEVLNEQLERVVLPNRSVPGTDSPACRSPS